MTTADKQRFVWRILVGSVVALVGGLGGLRAALTDINDGLAQGGWIVLMGLGAAFVWYTLREYRKAVQDDPVQPTSIPVTPPNFWTQMFWACALWLALELGLFGIVKLMFNATLRELVGPYLAFAPLVPAPVLVAWQLRKWEKRGPPPKRLALAWGLLVLLFLSLVSIAVVYSGVTLHLLRPGNIGGPIVIGVVGAAIASFTMYRAALQTISARADRGAVGSR